MKNNSQMAVKQTLPADAGFGIFWHDLSNTERDRIKSTPGLTVGEFMKRYKQPTWCEYPEALGGQMGCWSLVLTNQIHSIDDCKNCDLCRTTIPK